MPAVRTRFAPSPTGYLHIGSARTALYCFLYAQKMQGKFILRIEDTDRERSTAESIEAILEGMSWLALDYDEGPFYQTDHMGRYHEVIEEMLVKGTAYRCYCSKERLETLRAQQMAQKQKPRYDGLCREVEEQEGPYVVRFKNPIDGVVEFDDLVRGKLQFANNELDDLIIARTDGTPTYNFTVVIDDMDMQITHVIRGDDHINNTPRQINILQALGGSIPLYAHLPMILGSDGKRLSKRHGAVSVMQYRDEGILPHALLNYLARLGWSHGDQEIFSRAELIEFFDLTSINRAPAAFNPEKLLWLNQHYIKTINPSELVPALAWQFQQLNIDTSHGPSLEDVIVAQRERVKTLKEMAERSRYFYAEFAAVPIPPEVQAVMEVLYQRFSAIESWTAEAIHAAIAETAAEHNLKMGKIAQPLRMIVTGGTVSPPIDETLRLVGKKRTLARIRPN